MKHDCAVAVFARAPVPGTVKTRLLPELGESGAAELHEVLVTRTLETVASSGLGPAVLWCAPSTDHPFLRDCAARFDLQLALQTGLTLGDRMHNACEYMLREHEHMLLVGSDCPELCAGDLRIAARWLEEDSDVVLGPAEDGGYYLIGTNRAEQTMFAGVDWGSPHVLMQTRVNLTAACLRWRELAVRWDLDRPEDLERYRK
ncbi:MAG: TIGR04282 family arsenosugar biosynthesis glycosyltransferase [Gammaproteobacteria bacterium]|nr:TIGR04282 family arsenosugar biosynthesis glycosyltransferase [Gammaproteobacteria bacterium]